MKIDRRAFTLSGLSASATLGLGAPAILGQAKPRVVVIGGGAGGATAARYLAKDSQGAITVTLVEENETYQTCFHADETYALTAYLLFLNDIVKDEDFELSDKNFTSVKLPNAGAFYDDDRETAEKAFWGKEPCMTNCKPEVKITGRAAVLDVTPDSKSAPKVD